MSGNEKSKLVGEKGAEAAQVTPATPVAPATPQAKPKKAVPEAANFRLLQSACEVYLDEEGCEKVNRAYRFAADFHKDQRRRSGWPGGGVP